MRVPAREAILAHGGKVCNTSKCGSTLYIKVGPGDVRSPPFMHEGRSLEIHGVLNRHARSARPVILSTLLFPTSFPWSSRMSQSTRAAQLLEPHAGASCWWLLGDVQAALGQIAFSSGKGEANMRHAVKDLNDGVRTQRYTTPYGMNRGLKSIRFDLRGNGSNAAKDHFDVFLHEGKSNVVQHVWYSISASELT